MITNSEFESRLRDVISNFNNLRLDKGKYEAMSLLELSKKNKENYIKLKDEDNANEWLIREMSIRFIFEYIEFYTFIKYEKYKESWTKLQDALDILKLLTRFDYLYCCYDLVYFKKRLTQLEMLYPYSVFMSIGGVFGNIKCSICGNDIRSRECKHITGQIYNGKLASRIMSDAKIDHISFVNNPYDKRCIVEPAGGFNKAWTNLLSKLINIDSIVIRDFEVIEYIKNEEIKNSIDENMSCYCGSGKTFLECCWDKLEENERHIRINLGEVKRIDIVSNNT